MITHTRVEILQILEGHPLLIIFLKKKKIYLKYIKYSMNPNWNIDHINKLILGPKEIISFSFLWADTPEGREFWSNLNKEYKDFCDEY